MILTFILFNKKMTFLTSLKVQPIRGTNKRRVIEPLIYNDNLFGIIVVMSGFVSNYASIPKFIPRWIIDQDDPIIRDASVVHDYLYDRSSTLNISRKEADGVLYRAMRDLGAGFLISKLTYYAVRINGKSYWRR